MDTPLTLDRRSFLRAATAGLSALALGSLTGCGKNDNGTSSDAVPSRLTVLFNDAPTSLEPTTGWDGWYTVCRGITETLVRFNESMETEPWLATGWEQVDDLTWRFTLQEGVTFQTGAPMDAEAVKASIERTVALSTRAADKLKLDSITAEGNDIIIRTKDVIATIPGELAEPVFSIVDVTTADATPETSGTGPFMGGSITSMENFTLVRFPDYWNGAAVVEELSNQTVTEPSARTIALQSGDADVAWSIQAADLGLFRDNPDYHLIESESVRVVLCFCNYLNPHLAQHEVREALSYACDRESICTNLLDGSVEANGTPFPTYLPYSKDVASLGQTYDPDKARELLAQAGYTEGASGMLEKDGEPLSLRIAYYEHRPELPVIAQALQDQLAQIGIAAEPQLYENVDDLFHTDGFDLMLYNTTAIGNGDPSYYLELYYDSTGSENAGSYSNPQLDTIIEALRAELNQEKRFEMAVEAQKIILDDCPNLFIGSPIMNLVADADVTGVVLYPVEYYGITNEIA